MESWKVFIKDSLARNTNNYVITEVRSWGVGVTPTSTSAPARPSRSLPSRINYFIRAICVCERFVWERMFVCKLLQSMKKCFTKMQKGIKPPLFITSLSDVSIALVFLSLGGSPLLLVLTGEKCNRERRPKCDEFMVLQINGTVPGKNGKCSFVIQHVYKT